MGDSTQLDSIDLLAKWRLCRDRQKFRVQDGCCVLSPMDEMMWFGTPIVTYFAQPFPVQQICKVNPQRVILMIWPDTVSDTEISLRDFTHSGTAQVLSNIGGPLIFTQADHGPLAQLAWWGASNSGTAGCTVTEVILRDWPLEDK